MTVFAVGADVGCKFAGLKLQVLRGNREVVAVVEGAEFEWTQITQHCRLLGRIKNK